MATHQFSERQLYGGAITCEIPSSYLDVSDIRQVPDHQECFQSQENKPTLLVVEILGRESRVDNESAARFFFDDLAESNGVPMEHRAFHTIPMPHANIFAQGRQDANLLVHAGDTRVHLCAGIGFQKQVAMGRDFDQEGNSRSHLQDLQTIRVDLVVLRLLEQETDLLITVSTPMETSELPAAFSGAVQTNAMSAVILQAVSTLKIQDWGLFA